MYQLDLLSGYLDCVHIIIPLSVHAGVGLSAFIMLPLRCLRGKLIIVLRLYKEVWAVV